MLTLRLPRLEMIAERWSPWHPSTWLLGGERLQDGTLRLWFGPFHVAASPLRRATAR